MVNIDTVYQRVLILANKEQRGYITPQEFNLYANQAQMEIFEQYFYDLDQFSRTPSNSQKYLDKVAKATGKDCGCGERKDTLNRLFPYNN